MPPLLALQAVFDAAVSEETEVGPPRRRCRLNALLSPQLYVDSGKPALSSHGEGAVASTDETPTCARAALSALQSSSKKPAPLLARRQARRQQPPYEKRRRRLGGPKGVQAS